MAVDPLLDEFDQPVRTLGVPDQHYGSPAVAAGDVLVPSRKQVAIRLKIGRVSTSGAGRWNPGFIDV